MSHPIEIVEAYSLTLIRVWIKEVQYDMVNQPKVNCYEQYGCKDN